MVVSQGLAENRPAMKTCSIHERRAEGKWQRRTRFASAVKNLASSHYCHTAAVLCYGGIPVTSLQDRKWRLGTVHQQSPVWDQVTDTSPRPRVPTT